MSLERALGSGSNLTVMSNDSLRPEFSVGSRCQVKTGAMPRLQGRMGTVVGFSQTRNGVRVVFDGFKSPQTLHRRYLSLVAPEVESTEQDRS